MSSHDCAWLVPLATLSTSCHQQSLYGEAASLLSKSLFDGQIVPLPIITFWLTLLWPHGVFFVPPSLTRPMSVSYSLRVTHCYLCLSMAVTVPLQTSIEFSQLMPEQWPALVFWRSKPHSYLPVYWSLYASHQYSVSLYCSIQSRFHHWRTRASLNGCLHRYHSVGTRLCSYRPQSWIGPEKCVSAQLMGCLGAQLLSCSLVPWY